MADEETTEVEVAETAPVAEAPAVMDVETALKLVLKNALVHDGVARGLHECAKTLDKGQAQLCVLSADCSEPEYTKLVEALCAEHGVNLMKVSDKKQLGEWVGLAKLDQEGAARKVRPLKPCTQPSLGLSRRADPLPQLYGWLPRLFSPL